MQEKKLTYGDVLRAYYDYDDAEEILAMVYGDNNIPRKKLDAFRKRKIKIMRDGIADLLGNYYDDNDALLRAVSDYIQRMQEEAIARRGF